MTLKPCLPKLKKKQRIDQRWCHGPNVYRSCVPAGPHQKKNNHGSIAANPYSNIPVNSVDNKFYIKCMYTNIDGISNKITEFSLRVKKVKPHIIFITETKLCASDLTSDFFQIEHYSAFP